MLKKTHFYYVHITSKVFKLYGNNIQFSDKILKTRYCRIVWLTFIDGLLSWHHFIRSIMSKVSKDVRIPKSASPCASETHHGLLMYFTHFSCYLSYFNMQPLEQHLCLQVTTSFILQKRKIRCTYNVEYLHHTGPRLFNLKTLSLYDRRQIVNILLP